jgi:hypothetical protein
MEFENSLDLSVKRSVYAHFSEQHWAPIFCGIDQHLNRQSPFRRIAFRLREFPNIIPGISQCSSRPLTGQRHGLIKRTIPGHCILRKRRKPHEDSSLPGEDTFPRYDVASPFPWFGIVRIAGALRDRASVSFLLPASGARLTSYWKAAGERAKAACEGWANQALGADRFRGFLKRKTRV